MPVTQLKKVVLPAPLGPIRATISPSKMSRLTVSTARRPPKSMVRSLTSSSFLPLFVAVIVVPSFHGVVFVFAPHVVDQALRPEDHHQHHHGAEDHHAVFG